MNGRGGGKCAALPLKVEELFDRKNEGERDGESDIPPNIIFPPHTD